MPKVLELELGVAELIRMVEEQKKKSYEPVVVAIAGASASGKTSQGARRLKDHFGMDAALISMDDYYLGNSALNALRAAGTKITWDEPGALDMSRLDRDLMFLRSGIGINKPLYNFESGEPKGSEDVDSRPVIILEGLFALHERFRNVADIKVFVEIGLHGRLMRRIFRDIVWTTMPPAEILEYFTDVVEPMHQEHIERTKRGADLVIMNEYNPYLESYRAGMTTRQLRFTGWKFGSRLPVPFERLGTVRQTDTYFCPTDRDLRQTDESLRIRHEGHDFILTYKGPKEASAQNSRPVIEFPISAEVAERFATVYGRHITTVTKERTLYLVPCGVMTRDTVERTEDGQTRSVGLFTEVRISAGATQDAIADLWTKLKLNPAEAILTPYHQM